ncbi:hypothetical protein AB9W99_003955 [Providencia rettgeri]|nr:hypothetical protein [Providencia rettgeri]EIJ7167986.1 hypothetical protein [Providencia rettgeri]
MQKNNVKTTTQKSIESWNKRKNVLIERLLNKSAEIRRIHTPITHKKEEAKLDRALIQFAKIKAELDTHHWQANKRTDAKVLSVWKLTRAYILDTLDNLDRARCQKLEREYQNHVLTLNHQ